MQLYMQDTGSYIIYLRAEACEDSYFTRISVKINLQKGVFTHLEGTYANLLDQKKTLLITPHGWLFHCFGAPIWQPLLHVKTLYYNSVTLDSTK